MSQPRLLDVLLSELGDDDLDRLAELLAPRLAPRLERLGADGWLRGASEIAAYLGCSPSRVYVFSSNGHGPPLQHDGKALCARRSDLDAWVRSGGEPCR